MTHGNSEPSAVRPRGLMRWLRPNVGTALVLATVLSLLTFMLTSDGAPVTDSAIDDAPVGQLVAAENDGAAPAVVLGEPVATASEIAPETTGEEPVPLVAAALESRASAGFAADSAVGAVAAASLITNMGPTEVGIATNFPSVNYTWQRIELSSPGPAEMSWLGQLDGLIVSVSPNWLSGSQTQTLVTHASSDGAVWEMTSSYELPEDTWVSRVVGDGQRIVAIGERWSDNHQQAEYFLFSSEDGESWSEASLDLGAAPGENVYIQNVVMGPAGIAFAAQFETYPEEPPMVLLLEPYEVTLDHAHRTYTLTDMTSGDVVVTGSMDELFNWAANGQTVYDPATGGLLTTVPYELWERAWSEFYGPGWGGSPLPIPIGTEDPVDQTQIVIEHDGLVIEVSEYAGTYAVSNADTGDQIASGTLDELYQGPPPTFRDPDTGEVVLSVTWDEWYQAEEQSHMDREFGEPYEYNYSSRTALFTSVDGENWASETIADGSGTSTSYLAATADGFVAMVQSYEEYGGDRGTVWTMSRGTWSATTLDTRTDLWLQQVAYTDDGLVGVGDGAGGQAVWFSEDGVTWASEFAIVPQDDGSHAWLTDVSSDEAGTVGALAVRERWSDYSPLVIEQEQYTATFEDGEVALRVAETGSGETVVTFNWQELEDGSAADLIAWDGEATTIDLGNGDVMVITDDEAFAATESRYAGTGQIGLSVFLKAGGEWAETVVDVEGEMSGASQLLIVDGQIIIGGSYWGIEPYYDGPGENTFVILVGTPPGG